MQTLDAIVGYVKHFFSCSECATHFAAMAATREFSIRTMAERGGRDRAALWLWRAHNTVNERLAGEQESSREVEPKGSALAEFAKPRWPTRQRCASCHRVHLDHHGAKPRVEWDHGPVLRQLSSSYCLEPHFECWAALQHRMARPRAGEAQARRGAAATLAAVCAMLLLAFGCCIRVRGGAAKAGAAGKKKADHVV